MSPPGSLAVVAACLGPVVDRALDYARDVIARFACDLHPGTVLDLGAGTGADLETIHRLHPAARRIALEQYPPHADSLAAHGVEVHMIDAERERLPLQDDSVDLIIADQFLEHVKEVFWVLHESSRVLRVGGSFIIGVPNLAAAHNRVLLLTGHQPTQLRNWSAHVRGYTRGDLVELVARPFPGGYRVTRSTGEYFSPLRGRVAHLAARVWPGGAGSIFVRFEKMSAYSGQYLAWSTRMASRTNFRNGPG